MKKINATTKDVKQKLTKLDPVSLQKFQEIQEFFKETYNLQVSDNAVMRRAIDKYHRFIQLKLIKDKNPRLLTDEPERVYRAANLGESGFGII